MKRKQEQGSMQLQGEVQDLAIEEWPTTQFPLDTIEEIKVATEFPVMKEDEPFFSIYLCNHRDEKWHEQGNVIKLE